MNSINNIDNFSQSLSDHSFIKHGHEFRNEKPDGSPRSNKRTYGEPIKSNTREELSDHVRETLDHPDTRYIVDDTTGRMMFSNETTGTVIIFNPGQMTEGDGHAGSVLREKPRERGQRFNREFDAIKERTGQEPDIRNAADGQWAERLSTYEPELQRAADHARQHPPLNPGEKLPQNILDQNQLNASSRINIDTPSTMSRLGNAAGRAGFWGGMVVGGSLLLQGEFAEAAETMTPGAASVVALSEGRPGEATVALAEEFIPFGGEILRPLAQLAGWDVDDSFLTAQIKEDLANRTPAELQFEIIYDNLPTEISSDMSPELRSLVELKILVEERESQHDAARHGTPQETAISEVNLQDAQTLYAEQYSTLAESSQLVTVTEELAAMKNNNAAPTITAPTSEDLPTNTNSQDSVLVNNTRQNSLDLS